MEYSAIVFDTAPTGHTLRFLSFPSVLEKALGKLSTLSGRIGPMINQVCIVFVSASRRCSFRVDVYADGRPSGSYRRHVLEA
jgi:anion-transporting  ArsA/GET3 family ATPase